MNNSEKRAIIYELEEKGRILRGYKEKFRQMCQENKMIKGSTVLKLYDKIEEIQREYEHLDNKLTLMEYNFI
ncbi:MAG TPA: hypothetical protein PLH20_00285 [Flavobacterium sp.]|nr:hypothetical protein [Flavobacterium sp.]